MGKNSKTIVLGLDAATWSIMKPLLKSGDLPNLKDLAKKGVSGNLTSTTPPMTPLAWNSIVTGVNPGKHGIYDFVQQDSGSYEITPIVSDGVELEVPAIWDLFSQQKRKVGVMNFPLSYPPPENEPFFISGISSPESGDFTYPSELKKRLQQKDYRIHPRFGAQDNPPGKYIEEVEELTQKQLEVALNLLQDYDLDMFWAVFMGIDWVQHYLWNETINGEKAVNRIYRFMDTVVGELLEAIGSEWNVLVLSDHGFSEISGEIHLNNLLEKWGYLKRKEQDISSLNKIQNTVFENSKKFPQSVTSIYCNNYQT
ncbi:alkaline phosphatase family protein [Candidatus Bipolaricaulota bacterium]|nr:alkaline phosphatase family protein [Candidatus Bipolaricaulota bacterium]